MKNNGCQRKNDEHRAYPNGLVHEINTHDEKNHYEKEFAKKL